jgi:TPP-dependent pyruvate/acetoin dehydrogenase alpha subunit
VAARCPVETMGAKLMAQGALTKAAQAGLEAEIGAEVDASFEFAVKSAFPDPATVRDHVYA